MAAALLIAGCHSTRRVVSAVPFDNDTAVRVSRSADGAWVLLVDGEPYFVRGVTYRVSRVGDSPDEGYPWTDWTHLDVNRNGLIDGPFEAWVDANRNNIQDDGEAAVGDYPLLEQMGVNTIRWYHNAAPDWRPNKDALRALFFNHGIRVAVGDLLGASTGSPDAAPPQPVDYRSPYVRERLRASVRRMVEEHRHEPYVLLWLLGNANEWPPAHTTAADDPVSYASFVNEMAQLIHELDDRHPVAVVAGELDLLNAYADHAPDVDIFGVSATRGPDGFGLLWEGVQYHFDRPVLITAYGGAEAPGHDEEHQAEVHKTCWLNILDNRAGADGAGNAIGGFAEEWLDHWWAAGSPNWQAHRGMAVAGRRGMMTWEHEWTGICGQGDGLHSPFKRQVRQVYEMYQSLWVGSGEAVDAE